MNTSSEHSKTDLDGPSTLLFTRRTRATQTPFKPMRLHTKMGNLSQDRCPNLRKRPCLGINADIVNKSTTTLRRTSKMVVDQ